MNTVKTMVKFADIMLGFHFASGDEYGEARALLCKETGKIYYISDIVEEDEDFPEDIDDDDLYMDIPNKTDLDLGRQLVFNFASEYLPQEQSKIYSFFERKGAYARFKNYLAEKEILDQWFTYEETTQENAVRQWCKQNDIDFEE
ncbi:MAG: hypothetical protein ABUK01_16210 [Leptospirales bacterium]